MSFVFIMNINCIICSDLFIPTSAIYVTHCGHIFHYTCLLQWIERSKTCPQCRNRTNEKTIFRIFFNILTQEGIEDDAVTLQNKLDAANLQLRLKENHVKSADVKMKNITYENEKLLIKCKQLKADLEKSKMGLDSLKDQLQFFKDRGKYVDKLQNDIQEMRTKLTRKEQELKGITGDLDDLYCVVNTNNCPETLATIAKSLKKELLRTEKKKQNYFLALKKTENELHSCKKELEDITAEFNVQKQNLLAHENCDKELQYLKDKIRELRNSNDVVDSSLTTTVNETSSPGRILSGLEDSPTVEQPVQEQVQKPNSPYVRIKSSQLGIMQANPRTTLKYGSDNISIFKNFGIDPEKEFAKPLPEYNYDGFGGHSKEDKFPVPIKTGIKRTKRMTSSKFKKLARPNKKLDEFLSLSQL